MPALQNTGTVSHIFKSLCRRQAPSLLQYEGLGGVLCRKAGESDLTCTVSRFSRPNQAHTFRGAEEGPYTLRA